MMNGLIRWSLGNRPVVLMLAGLLLWFGWREVEGAAVDVFPDLTAPSVSVLTEAPGLRVRILWSISAHIMFMAKLAAPVAL